MSRGVIFALLCFHILPGCGCLIPTKICEVLDVKPEGEVVPIIREQLSHKCTSSLWEAIRLRLGRLELQGVGVKICFQKSDTAGYFGNYATDYCPRKATSGNYLITVKYFSNQKESVFRPIISYSPGGLVLPP